MRGTRALWLVMAAAMAGLLLYTDFDLLPAPYELVLESDDGPPASGIGTAFSVGDGVWLTARHVVDACETVVFLDGRQAAGLAQRTVHHPSADLSLLFSDLSAEPLPIAAEDDAPSRHSTAYLFGFPRGVPRGFAAALVEARDLDRENPREKAFPILVWAEQPRPDGFVDYGGLSGGPVIAPGGMVVGVSVGSDVILGRILAAAPSLLREMVSGRFVAAERVASGPPIALADALGTDTPADMETALRRQGRIRQIYCHVG